MNIVFSYHHKRQEILPRLLLVDNLERYSSVSWTKSNKHTDVQIKSDFYSTILLNVNYLCIFLFLLHEWRIFTLKRASFHSKILRGLIFWGIFFSVT